MKRMLLAVLVLLLLVVCFAACEEHVHSFGEWETVKAADCSNEGEERRSCECGEIDTRTTSATHQWGEWSITDPTCKTAGKQERACAACGATDSLTLPATGTHVYPTDNTCSSCGETLPYTETGIIYDPINQQNCWVVGVEDTLSGDVVIPAYHNGMRVSVIADYAFQNNTAITSVFIPATVARIEMYAFENATALTSVTFPTSSCLSEIGSGAFFGCSALESFNVPAFVEVIGNSAFRQCSSLVRVGFAPTCALTTVKTSAFRDCTSLTELALPRTVTKLGSDVFFGCDKLVEVENGIAYLGKWVVGSKNATGNAMLRAGTVGIADYAFFNQTNLTGITIPTSITMIGSDAFSGTSGVLQKDENSPYYYVDGWVVGYEGQSYTATIDQMVIKEGVRGIADGAFFGSRIKHFSFPASLRYIGNEAFWGSESATFSFAAGSSLERIGSEAFAACDVSGIALPSSLMYIGNGAFSLCDSSTVLTVPASVTFIGKDAFDDFYQPIVFEQESGWFLCQMPEDTTGTAFTFGSDPNINRNNVINATTSKYLKRNKTA